MRSRHRESCAGGREQVGGRRGHVQQGNERSPGARGSSSASEERTSRVARAHSGSRGGHGGEGPKTPRWMEGILTRPEPDRLQAGSAQRPTPSHVVVKVLTAGDRARADNCTAPPGAPAGPAASFSSETAARLGVGEKGVNQAKLCQKREILKGALRSESQGPRDQSHAKSTV